MVPEREARPEFKTRARHAQGALHSVLCRNGSGLEEPVQRMLPRSVLGRGACTRRLDELHTLLKRSRVQTQLANTCTHVWVSGCAGAHTANKHLHARGGAPSWRSDSCHFSRSGWTMSMHLSSEMTVTPDSPRSMYTLDFSGQPKIPHQLGHCALLATVVCAYARCAQEGGGLSCVPRGVFNGALLIAARTAD